VLLASELPFGSEYAGVDVIYEGEHLLPTMEVSTTDESCDLEIGWLSLSVD
jgi:hypothetical protein